MTIFDAAVQGIIQGLTEFLPVSSSGHLLISQHILGVQENNLFFRYNAPHRHTFCGFGGVLQNNLETYNFIFPNNRNDI